MDTHLKKGLRLEYITVAWNIFECIIVLIAAVTSGSIALLGFGIDSLIEIFAGFVAIWHLRGIHERGERRALKLIGLAFLGVAIYIFGEAIFSLISNAHARPSPLGIVSLFATVIAMSVLSFQKLKVGKAMKNNVLIAEAKVTRVDGMLAAATLIGVLLNSIFGLWWADTVAGFIIVIYGFKEGIHALRQI
ncbi:MAG TPA: cation transporter [Candidatus Saccharimonadales bacterium]|nr:cation transporter [Candidatus Saccharimonadales bacterium]